MSALSKICIILYKQITLYNYNTSSLLQVNWKIKIKKKSEVILQAAISSRSYWCKPSRNEVFFFFCLALSSYTGLVSPIMWYYLPLSRMSCSWSPKTFMSLWTFIIHVIWSLSFVLFCGDGKALFNHVIFSHSRDVTISP